LLTKCLINLLFKDFVGSTHHSETYPMVPLSYHLNLIVWQSTPGRRLRVYCFVFLLNFKDAFIITWIFCDCLEIKCYICTSACSLFQQQQCWNCHMWALLISFWTKYLFELKTWSQTIKAVVIVFLVFVLFLFLKLSPFSC